MNRLKDLSLFTTRCLIGGRWRESGTKATVEVVNPATGKALGTVPDCGTAEAREAIEAASAAFAGWRARTHAERAALLERWHTLIAANAEDLARILTLEQGKPLSEARGEIGYGNAFVKWFSEEARRIGGSAIPSPTPDRRILALKEPVGVCAIIT